MGGSNTTNLAKSFLRFSPLKNMINPHTKKECTEIELLKMISEDVGRLSKIEYTLQEEGEHSTIYNRIHGIEFRALEAVQALLSIKKLLIAIICLLAGILLFSIFK